MHAWILSYLKNLYIKPFLSVNVTVLFDDVSSFLPMLLLKLFHFLQVNYFYWVDINKFSFMLYTTSQYSSTFHSFFNKEKTSTETETKLDFIWSIWDYDHILRLDEKNWKCLWCNTNCQGINTTKDLAHILGKKGMYI